MSIWLTYLGEHMDAVTPVKKDASFSEAEDDERARAAPPMFDLIELLFFAYRDFIGDADRLLESINFGRAHHRVLHFVNRQSGLTIAELLDILRITKQSLSRVLKDLIEQGFVEQRAGAVDRRQRHLRATPKGRRLALRLAGLQSERFAAALSALPPDTRHSAVDFLLAMIDPSEREKVAQLVWPDARNGPNA